METKNMTQEQISALLDSELSDAHVEGALSALRQSEGRATWDVYHQIGDVLRSDDMAQAPSKDFMARMMARLDEEPPILAPPISRPNEQAAQAAGGRFSPNMKRFGFPAAIAAAVVCALVVAPQLVKSPKGDQVLDQQTTVIAPNGGPIAQVSDKNAPDGSVVRDPRFNQYLLAHQRVSPSWNSSAQYARSATYTVTSDTDK